MADVPAFRIDPEIDLDPANFAAPDIIERVYNLCGDYAALGGYRVEDCLKEFADPKPF